MRSELHEERAEFELALLRRGMHERDAERERCGGCGRTPLIGERVFSYENGTLVCELCRALGDRSEPARARVVHGPEFGHTMKIVDHRAAATG